MRQFIRGWLSLQHHARKCLAKLLHHVLADTSAPCFGNYCKMLHVYKFRQFPISENACKGTLRCDGHRMKGRLIAHQSQPNLSRASLTFGKGKFVERTGLLNMFRGGIKGDEVYMRRHGNNSNVSPHRYKISGKGFWPIFRANQLHR